MVKIKVTNDGLVFVNESGVETISEIFDEIHPTKDIEGFYLCKNIWGDMLLVSNEGNIVFEFSSKDKPTGVSSLLNKILDIPDTLLKIKALEFYGNKNVRETLKLKHDGICRLDVEKALLRDDTSFAGKTQIMHDIESNYFENVFNKMESLYQKELKKRVESTKPTVAKPTNETQERDKK